MAEYRSPLIAEIHDRIMADEAARKIFAEALRRELHVNGYVGLCDSISLEHFIIDYYGLPEDYFFGVSYFDFQQLGETIISANG